MTLTEKLNWKKILLFSTVAAFAPTLGQWASAAQSGNVLPFTAGNILVPAIPSLVATLAALFSNPRQLR